MTVTRKLPPYLLGADGRLTFAAMNALSAEAAAVGLRYVPANARPARYSAAIEALWLAPGDDAAMILVNGTLTITERA